MKKGTRLKQRNTTQANLKRTNGFVHGYGRKLERTLSAALIASTIMAGSAFAQDLIVDDPLTPYLIDDVTESYDSVFLLNDASILGTGDAGIDASVLYDFESGLVDDVSLGGTAGLLKTTAGTVTLTGSNTYTGTTTVLAGTLELAEGASIASSGTVILDDSGFLELNLDSGSVFTNDISNGVVGGTAVVVSGTGETTLSGVISGVGVFSQEGPGLTILTGENTYTGATQILDGALQIGDGTTGSIDPASTVFLVNPETALGINLADGETFGSAVNLGAVDTSIFALADGTNIISGPISGVGDFIQFGTGTTILTGANTYTGSTFVDTGTLQVGDGVSGSIDPTGDVTVAPGATLAINLADTGVFGNDVINDGLVTTLASGANTIDGIISGTGDFTQAGTGITFLNNFNTYTGVTTVLNGTLSTLVDFAISDQSAVLVNTGATLDFSFFDQAIGSLADGPDGGGIVDIEGATLFTGADNTNTTFSGSIVGIDGEVVKEGTGIWTLNGVNTYTGDTFIDGGAIVVNGSVEGDVIVDSGILAGRGVIFGSVFNNSIVTPGNARRSVGTLTIGEDYVQSSDGAYIVNIRSKTSHDKLEIGGSAFLAGDLIVDRNGYQANRRDSLRILRAAGGVNGTFDDVFDNFGETMLILDVDYRGNSVYLEFEQRKFASLSGLTPNQKAVAKALDKAVGKDQLNSLIDQLNTENISDIPDQLSLLSPESLTAIFHIGFATSQIQNINIERRLDDVRAGSVGFSTNGMALTNSRGTLNYEGLPLTNSQDGLTLAGWDGKSVVSKKTIVPLEEEVSRWGFFITGTGEWADIETTWNSRGSEFTTGGFTLGVDYRVSENFVVGLSGGYANTGSDLYNDGRIELNGGRGSLYATWFGGGGYLNGVVGGGYNSYETRRGTLGGQADGDTDGGEFNALLGGGYDFSFGGFSVGPIASAQYTYIGLSSFQETGSDAPLYYNSQHQESFRSTLGLKVAYGWNCGGMVIKPEVRAQWKHEYLDSTASMESRFVGADSIFTVDGPDLGRDSLLLDAGISVQVNPAVAVYAYYTGEIGRENYSSNAVNGGFRIAF